MSVYQSHLGLWPYFAYLNREGSWGLYPGQQVTAPLTYSLTAS